MAQPDHVSGLAKPSAGRLPRIGELRNRLTLSPIALAFAVLVAGSLIAYATALLRGGGHPRSSLGLTYGIGAAAAFVAVMLYSIRRALPAVRRLGPARAYLEVHLYGGLLFLLLALLHTAFAVPSGTFTLTLWLVSLWVVASGVLGFLLQRWLPPVLDASSSIEVHLERIPELVTELRARAEAAAAGAGPRLQMYYAREVAPDMVAPRAAASSLLARNRSQSYRVRELEILRHTLPAEAAPALDEVRRLHDAKLEMDLSYTVQRILRVWLWLHVPAAVVLLGLIALHIFFVVYY